MDEILLFDFGSTFTKGAVVSKSKKELIFHTKTPTTIETRAMDGMATCLKAMGKALGSHVLQAEKYASSSAAGGLRISVFGLTDNLSLLAAKNAAFGAGGKIVHFIKLQITDQDIQEMMEKKTEIFLFTGGYEGGNRKTLIENAKILAKSPLDIPIIYAGNTYIQKEIQEIFESSGQECILVDNLIPRIHETNISSTEEMIRTLFMTRITDMKGMEEVKKCLNGPIIPTPAAVLEAGGLLARPGKDKGLGPTMILDLGGATTDVYSFCPHIVEEHSRYVGIVEPFSKRTVEGDLGMRESSKTIVDLVGQEYFMEDLGLEAKDLEESIENRLNNHEFLPDSSLEKDLDHSLASVAVREAARRHVGHVEIKNYKTGEAIQLGKNLESVEKIIGTGGQLIFKPGSKEILQEVLKKPGEDQLLLPKEAQFFVDGDYCLYAAGLLAKDYKDLAQAIALKSLKECK